MPLLIRLCFFFCYSIAFMLQEQEAHAAAVRILIFPCLISLVSWNWKYFFCLSADWHSVSSVYVLRWSELSLPSSRMECKEDWYPLTHFVCFRVLSTLTLSLFYGSFFPLYEKEKLALHLNWRNTRTHMHIHPTPTRPPLLYIGWRFDPAACFLHFDNVSVEFRSQKLFPALSEKDSSLWPSR